jgi:glycosyltransferase involved in cell wall biosynthesis
VKSRLVIFVAHRLELFVYRSADHIVVIGPEMKRRIVAKGISAHKIEVIPQGYQPSDLPQPDRDAARRRFGLTDEFVVMFTGSYGLANNDTETILSAAEALRDEPNLAFLLVGDGDRKDEYVERARRLGLRGVSFIPMVPSARCRSCWPRRMLASWPAAGRVGRSSPERFRLSRKRPIAVAVSRPADLLRESVAACRRAETSDTRYPAVEARVDLARRLGQEAPVRSHSISPRDADRYESVERWVPDDPSRLQRTLGPGRLRRDRTGLDRGTGSIA